MSAPVESIFAVALMPGAADGEVREVRVVAVNLFGGTPADCIGGIVREVDGNGVPYAGRAESIVPVQRLVFARRDETGRRTVPGAELSAKRAEYAARLAAGPGPAFNLFTAPRRRPRLPADDAPVEAGGWAVAHERETEAAA
jgi:hypothetical protein